MNAYITSTWLLYNPDKPCLSLLGYSKITLLYVVTLVGLPQRPVHSVRHDSGIASLSSLTRSKHTGC